MKKIGILFFGLIFLLSCQPKEATVEDEKNYPRKDRFIVSENNRWLDSIKNAAFDKGLEIEQKTLRGIPSDFVSGKFHFIILDEEDAFYYSKAKTYPDVLLCGVIDNSDIERERKSFNKYLDSIQPIKLTDIRKYLTENRDEIIAGKEYRQSPVNITFALKNDTLKGSFMHDILNFMEDNGMNAYMIRRINNKELEAVENYSE
ncbi:hypothetical protein [Moheibacter lacus]|uniref:Lipoprotein n=1 Tax=Moheibacter lacus TaxID=2745851 RepID=A0A838ZNZ5_9FLAO|nr:hypothetical protein [Moheibacter lacus]MBA5628465.1 hypothetical protein [Moheibacter lacus]